MEEEEMAYDRDDTRRRSRGEPNGWPDGFRGGRGRPGGRGERGFLERAGDEIASWFGEDDGPSRGRERDYGGRAYGERDRHEERSRFGGRGHEQGRGHGSENRMSGQGRYEPSAHSWEPSGDRDHGGYRPMTGDYSRSERSRGGYGRDNDFDDRGSRFGQSQEPRSNWDQDDYRRTSFAGSRESSQHHDPHYQQWRERQLSELDRDYHEYHRERQSRFEDDFGNWRERRQQKRQMIGQVRDHMEVVGKDGEHVGTVDKATGDRIILTRSDPQAGGAHHSISCNAVDRIEDNRVLLDCTADEARKRWRNEDRSRALFEREGQGENGPHMLDRSFSGTYRD